MNPFEQAKQAYPNAWHQPGWSTWQLVDACSASFRTPEREGQLVLREIRPGCRTPFHFWGNMIAKQEVSKLNFHDEVTRLASPALCEYHDIQAFYGHSLCGGEQTPVCEVCMQDMSEMNSDNEEFYAPALADIRERRRDFMRLMRRPESAMLRELLIDLRNDAGVEWRGLTSMQIVAGYHRLDSWAIHTEPDARASLAYPPGSVGEMTYWTFSHYDMSDYREWAREEVSA